MKKSLLFIFAGVLALLAFSSCDNKKETVNDHGSEYDYYYAALATVSSSDTNFTANNDGGTIRFKAEGGSVALNVDCGCEWFVENPAIDLFATSTTNSALTVTAGQNTTDRQQMGTITLKTANQRISFATISVVQTAYDDPDISVETNEWNFPAVGALMTEIGVEASAYWTAESADIWLIAEKSEAGVILTADENEGNRPRTTKVTLACTDGVGTSFEYITVRQEARAYITFSHNGLNFGSNAISSSTVTVESNYDWDYSYDTSNGWFIVGREDNELTVTVAVSTDEVSRSGMVTVTTGDGADDIVEAQLAIVQAGTKCLVLTYSVTGINNKITLPLDGTVNCTVNWGDCSAEDVTASAPSHTYPHNGEFNVIIEGVVTRLNTLNFCDAYNLEHNLVAVVQWGNTGLTSMEAALQACANLRSLATDTEGFANVTTFEYAFVSCESLTSIPENLFANCPKCTSFEEVFWMCTSLTSIPNDLFKNCPEAESFKYAFSTCRRIKSIPTGLFDNNKKTTNFSNVFSGLAITEIPTGLFDNCPEVNDFSYAFAYCEQLNAIPKEIFYKCKMVENFCGTFEGCSTLKTIPSGLFDNCPEVKDFSYIFDNMSSLTEIPKNLFDNCPKVNTFAYAFWGCTALTSIPVDIFSMNLNVNDFLWTFRNCTSVVGESPYTLLSDGTKVHLYERCDHISELGCVSPSMYELCFANSTFSDMGSIPSDWK